MAKSTISLISMTNVDNGINLIGTAHLPKLAGRGRSVETAKGKKLKPIAKFKIKRKKKDKGKDK